MMVKSIGSLIFKFFLVPIHHNEYDRYSINKEHKIYKMAESALENIEYIKKKTDMSIRLAYVFECHSVYNPYAVGCQYFGEDADFYARFVVLNTLKKYLNKFI